MKVAFYAPMKSPEHSTPSGDRTIARLLRRSLEDQGFDTILLSDYRSRHWLQSPLMILQAIWNLAKAFLIVIRTKPDAFFTYHVYRKVPDLIGCTLSWLFSKPYFIYEAMYSEKNTDTLSGKINFHLTKWAITRAQAVFSYKSVDTENLLRVVPHQRLVLLPPAVDTNLFKPDSEQRLLFRQKYKIPQHHLVIACTAMLRADRKSEGVLFLIKTLAQIRHEYPIHFILCGGGDREKDVQRRLVELLPNQHTFLGAVSREQVAEALQASDLFTFPGIDEGFGMVYLEAQSCALPVLAFDNGGLRDAVGPGAGILSPLDDYEAWMFSLHKLCADTKLRQEMGEMAREYILRHHDQTAMAQRLANEIKIRTKNQVSNPGQLVTTTVESQ